MAKTLTDACCVPAPPASHDVQGKLEHIVGLDVYTSGPASATKAIILAPDLFGYEAPLLRKLADKVASKGYLAVVPDYFHGDPLVILDNTTIGPWLSKHEPGPCITETVALIEYLKKERGITSVGISGFCYGAKVAIKIGASDNLATAVVLLHPSLLAPGDFAGLKVPAAVLPAESDGIEKFEEEIDARKKDLDIYVKVYKQAHGWSVRYNVDNESEVKAAEEAQAIMFDWYSKYL
eukprot:TRINITY_DN704_c0_g1_i1.p1 TRINITY_DN704_c0_g1~~TRINITY_DN704_c0_g1_i1.p1  ORF type:complete len:236 (-),score=45.09 TRINITY_DN704_c0_g1_i1:367-1074(-)